MQIDGTSTLYMCGLLHWQSSAIRLLEPKTAAAAPIGPLQLQQASHRHFRRLILSCVCKFSFAAMYRVSLRVSHTISARERKE